MIETDRNPQTLEQVKACCAALEDKKAEDLSVLYLGPRSAITDYYVIATGTSNPHLKALGKALRESLHSLDVTVLGSDSNPDTGWIVVDADDFMIHLFTAEQRERFRLESLWKDADRVELPAATAV